MLIKSDIISDWLKANNIKFTPVLDNITIIRFYTDVEENGHELEINFYKTHKSKDLKDHEVELSITIDPEFTCADCEDNDGECNLEDCDKIKELIATKIVTLADPNCFFIIDEAIRKGLVANIGWVYHK